LLAQGQLGHGSEAGQHLVVDGDCLGAAVERAERRPLVAERGSVTCGPGYTQIMTALTMAARGNAPVVVFAGDAPIGASWRLRRRWCGRSTARILCVDSEAGDKEANDAASAHAAYIVRLKTAINRVTGVPMELRAAVGAYDEDAARYTVYTGAGSGVVRSIRRENTEPKGRSRAQKRGAAHRPTLETHRPAESRSTATAGRGRNTF
jgi:hypothetical protein